MSCTEALDWGLNWKYQFNIWTFEQHFKHFKAWSPSWFIWQDSKKHQILFAIVRRYYVSQKCRPDWEHLQQPSRRWSKQHRSSWLASRRSTRPNIACYVSSYDKIWRFHCWKAKHAQRYHTVCVAESAISTFVLIMWIQRLLLKCSRRSWVKLDGS